MTAARTDTVPAGVARGRTADREGKVIPLGAARVRVVAVRRSCSGFAFVRAWRVEHHHGRRRAVEVDAGASLAGSTSPAVDLDAASNVSTLGAPSTGSLTAPRPARPGPALSRAGPPGVPPALGGALPRHFR